jgi:putative two-component system response regulator
MKILVADDDLISRELLAELLRHEDHDVDVVPDGAAALEAVRDGAYRMVVTDWMMPELEGVELCQEIRKLNLPGYIYLILVTSRDRPEDVVAGLAAGADDFISKPVEPSELQMRVRVGKRVLSLETRDMAIFAMAKLAESRDPETGAHLERIQGYVRTLTQQLLVFGEYRHEVDDAFVRSIHQTCPLHDIGKVGIPDNVLLKPGRLTDREFEIMKTHCEIGANALSAAVEQYPDVEYLRLARDIAQTHHERYDGSGYPQGLSGIDIPLCGRITAVADVFDALVSKRVYKDAFSLDVAHSIIADERGKQFDPHVVDAFFECEPTFRQILEALIDTDSRAPTASAKQVLNTV